VPFPLPILDVANSAEWPRPRPFRVAELAHLPSHRAAHCAAIACMPYQMPHRHSARHTSSGARGVYPVTCSDRRER